MLNETRPVPPRYTISDFFSSLLVSQLEVEWFSSNIGQVGHGAGVFDEFFQGGHDGGASKELAKEIDLAAQLIVRDGLDEFLGRRTRHRVKFRDLRSGRAGDAEGFAFAGKLRHEAHRLCASRVDRSSREEQIPYKSIAKITFQARDTAEAGDEPQTQLVDGEPRHLICDCDVSGQGDLHSPP